MVQMELRVVERARAHRADARLVRSERGHDLPALQGPLRRPAEFRKRTRGERGLSTGIIREAAARDRLKDPREVPEERRLWGLMMKCHIVKA